MSDPKTTAASVFEALGLSAEDAAWEADNDDGEALLRAVFVRMLGRMMVSTEDRVGGEPAWLEQSLRAVRSSAEATGSTAALVRVMEAGASAEDLTTIVRSQQWELLFNVCSLLDGDDAALEDLAEVVADLPEVFFGLVGVEESEEGDEQSRQVGGLHALFDELIVDEEG